MVTFSSTNGRMPQPFQPSTRWSRTARHAFLNGVIVVLTSLVPLIVWYCFI